MKDTVDVTVRRSPRYSVFIGLGVLVGFIVAGVLTALPVDTSTLTREFSLGSVLALLMAFLGIVGGFLGALVALILDRMSVKRALTYTVDATYEEVPASSPENAATSSADPHTATGDPHSSSVKKKPESDTRVEE